jgi:hypothetical protein
MNALNELKFNPLEHVATLESPIGIYLRREILKKKTEADTTLTRELYKKTVAGQSADGSWDQLFVRTANNLWNLALLDDDAKDKSINTEDIQASSPQATEKTQVSCAQHFMESSDQAARFSIRRLMRFIYSTFSVLTTTNKFKQP